MRFLLAFIIVISAYGDSIAIINGLYSSIDFNTLQKYAYTGRLQSSIDMQRHKYKFILLSKLKRLYCPYSKKIKFIAYNHNEVTFSEREIESNNIAFVFMKNNKPLLANGPAEIIYIKNKNPVKEICAIKTMVCLNK
jgi:hypothetical protein